MSAPRCEPRTMSDIELLIALRLNQTEFANRYGMSPADAATAAGAVREVLDERHVGIAPSEDAITRLVYMHRLMETPGAYSEDEAADAWARQLFSGSMGDARKVACAVRALFIAEQVEP